MDSAFFNFFVLLYCELKTSTKELKKNVIFVFR